MSNETTPSPYGQFHRDHCLFRLLRLILSAPAIRTLKKEVLSAAAAAAQLLACHGAVTVTVTQPGSDDFKFPAVLRNHESHDVPGLPVPLAACQCVTCTVYHHHDDVPVTRTCIMIRLGRVLSFGAGCITESSQTWHWHGLAGARARGPGVTGTVLVNHVIIMIAY